MFVSVKLTFNLLVRAWALDSSSAAGRSHSAHKPTACAMRRVVAVALAQLAGASALLRVAVAVVTYDRPAYLERCLANVASQTYPKELTSVVVVDDTPGDAARIAVEASTGAALACDKYVHLDARASIGAKRNLAADVARGLGCDVVATWDDDDVYGDDRLAAQLAPIAAGFADATVATPNAWRYEGGGAAADMTWGGWLAAGLAAVDPDGALGTEIVDEAIASLCYRTALHGGAAAYPDASYDEDRAFLGALKRGGARVARLPPGAPAYVHVKHARAAARGPLTQLYGAGLGALATPPAALAAVFAASAALRNAIHH